MNAKFLCLSSSHYHPFIRQTTEFSCVCHLHIIIPLFDRQPSFLVFVIFTLSSLYSTDNRVFFCLSSSHYHPFLRQTTEFSCVCHLHIIIPFFDRQPSFLLFVIFTLSSLSSTDNRVLLCLSSSHYHPFIRQTTEFSSVCHLHIIIPFFDRQPSFLLFVIFTLSSLSSTDNRVFFCLSSSHYHPFLRQTTEFSCVCHLHIIIPLFDRQPSFLLFVIFTLSSLSSTDNRVFFCLSSSHYHPFLRQTTEFSWIDVGLQVHRLFYRLSPHLFLCIVFPLQLLRPMMLVLVFYLDLPPLF